MREINGIVWLRLGMWKLRGEGGGEGPGRRRCLPCAEEDSESHLLLKCPEMHWWKEKPLNNKWSHINEEIALSKILTVKNATEHRNSGTLTYKIKCTWENQVKKEELRLGGEGELYVGSIGYK
jgi:hypothetical protein